MTLDTANPRPGIQRRNVPHTNYVTGTPIVPTTCLVELYVLEKGGKLTVKLGTKYLGGSTPTLRVIADALAEYFGRDLVKAVFDERRE